MVDPHGGADGAGSARGQSEVERAAVVGVRRAADETVPLEPIDDPRQITSSDEKLAGQVDKGHPGPTPGELVQHIELGQCEAIAQRFPYLALEQRVNFEEPEPRADSRLPARSPRKADRRSGSANSASGHLGSRRCFRAPRCRRERTGGGRRHPVDPGNGCAAEEPWCCAAWRPHIRSRTRGGAGGILT